MTKSRLEAFSDGVIAIIITIMVLELKVPHGDNLEALQGMSATFLCYVLSFIYIAIYWNNHHHLLHIIRHIDGRVLWANMHLLFWLSLVPFATAWMGENHFTKWPVAIYGFVMLMAGFAYWVLVQVLEAAEGDGSQLKVAVGSDAKGKISLLLYLAAIGLAFVHTAFSLLIFALVAAIWFIPDKRVEKQIRDNSGHM
jgi:uncharacterized membrane protein